MFRSFRIFAFLFLAFLGRGVAFGQVSPVVFAQGDFQPAAIAAEDSGSVVVANSKSGTMLRFDPNGSVSQVAVDSRIMMARDLIADDAGYLYLADGLPEALYFAPSGATGYLDYQPHLWSFDLAIYPNEFRMNGLTLADSPSGATIFVASSQDSTLTVDAEGNFISFQKNVMVDGVYYPDYIVVKANPNTESKDVLMDHNPDGGLKNNFFPSKIVVDNKGIVYFCDSGDGKIYEIDLDKSLRLIYDPKNSAFPSPKAQSISLDREGNLFAGIGNYILEFPGLANPSGTPLTYQKGDVNLDGTVSIQDAQVLLSGVVGLKSLSDYQIKRSDLNEDGIFNLQDVTILLRKAVGL